MSLYVVNSLNKVIAKNFLPDDYDEAEDVKNDW